MVSPALRSWWGLKPKPGRLQPVMCPSITGSSELVGIETIRVSCPLPTFRSITGSSELVGIETSTIPIRYSRANCITGSSELVGIETPLLLTLEEEGMYHRLFGAGGD